MPTRQSRHECSTYCRRANKEFWSFKVTFCEQRVWEINEEINFTKINLHVHFRNLMSKNKVSAKPLTSFMLTDWIPKRLGFLGRAFQNNLIGNFCKVV